MNVEKVLICSLNEYSFTDDNTGRLIEGASVWVMPLKAENEHVNGFQPKKYSIKLEKINELARLQLPVYADMHMISNISRQTIDLDNFDNFEDFIV